MNVYEEALALHERLKGKFEVVSRALVDDAHDLTLAYSPGVAEPCRQIHRDPALLNELTGRGNMIAVVSDGSAVLGLGNIGARAAMPVMEGKCVLFKMFGGVNACPLCVETQEPEEIVRVVKQLEPSFAGINLEDIAAPSCFAVEEALKAETQMLIFHDDQHGTAVVCLAGLLNALKVVGKEMPEIRVVMNGAGAAGLSITQMLLACGVGDVIICDRQGIIHAGRGGLNPWKARLAETTNRDDRRGSLAEALVGADVFIGVSVADVVTPPMVRSMAKDPIVFALANPEPEIWPADAFAAGAKVVCTGRSDYPNQVNNVLGFPGIFRGALDVAATDINQAMKVAAARALAELISPEELRADYVIPKPFDLRVAPQVAEGVAKAALESRVARRTVQPGQVAAHASLLVEQARYLTRARLALG